MQRFRLLCALLLVVSACSSAPAPEQANDLIFAGETPTPTIVAPADACLLYTSPSPRDRG